MRSLRATISLALVVMLAVIGCVASAISYRVGSFEAGQFMDDQMRQLAAVVDEDTRVDEVSALQEPEDRFAVTLWRADGRRIVLAEPGTRVAPSVAGFAVTRVDGVDWRTFAARHALGWVMIAQRMSARDEIATHAALEVAVPILATIPLAWLIVVTIVHRMLGRLTFVGKRLAEQGAEATAHVPTEGLPSEVLPFVEAINDRVERLRSALLQQQRFIADSAHQLRTPLAALTLQVANLRAQSGGDAPLTALRAGTARIAAMLDQLLLMAKFDAGRAAGAPEHLDLAELVTQCIADQIELAEAAEIDLGLVREHDAGVTGVRADLQVLLANLIENAIHYTPAGGRIDCTVSRDPQGHPTVAVTDTGPGVRDTDLPHLTDRFFRAADARANGSGLGLSIVKAIAERHGLSLAFANRSDGAGLCARVTFLADEQPN